MKKVNPRRRPATQADVKRAMREASDKGVNLSLACFLTVLKDDFEFDNEQVKVAWTRLNKLTEEIAEKRISAKDLLNTLEEEYGVVIR